MFCLVQINQEAKTGTADFGDATYSFEFDAYSYGSHRPSRFPVKNMHREGVRAVNPTRGAAIEDAVKRAWV